MKRKLVQSWLLRNLSTERAYSKVELMRMTGWAERTLRKGLHALRDRDLAKRLTLPEDLDHGTMPVVWMRTHNDYQMRVADRDLMAKALPVLQSLRYEMMRRRTAYIAAKINARKERERREAHA